MTFKNWEKFVKVTKNRKPVSFLTKTIKELDVSGKFALDLGCGAGVDVKYLAENGFKVEAIDFNKSSINQTKEICKDLNIEAKRKDIADFKINLKKYSLIIAWNSLSFLQKDKAKKVFINIQKGLKSGGFFVFSIFGIEDDWAKNHKEMSFWTIGELKKTLESIDFIKITEKKETKPGVTGEVKFWHLIQGIARKY
ncbi:MAG: class I SAM-dependent methyltransferase [Candidatus Nealsonbacteria bacterium]